MKLNKRQLIAHTTIEISGSKSISNRLLVLAKLFNNIRLEGVSNSQDTQLLQTALSSKEEVIDVHHAGTCMRFLTAYFSIMENKTTILTGSERMKERPIAPLVSALRHLGAEIDYLEKEGFPPLKIKGHKIVKSNVEIPADISSQFITALMLIGGKLNNGLQITLKGKITSLPYLKMTSEILNEIGVENSISGQKILIEHQRKSDTKIKYINIESDWSSASYFYSLCAIGKKTINLKSFKFNSLQGDSVIQKIYWEYFGVNSIIDSSENELSLMINPHFIYPQKIKLDMNDCPDIAQTLCVTASLLKIPFEISGLKTLKIKETDRLQALQNELLKVGCQTEITDDSIRSIRFKEMNSEIKIKTYNDHRMAMAFAPVCLLHGIEIENESVVEKSYPQFWEDLNTITKID